MERAIDHDRSGRALRDGGCIPVSGGDTQADGQIGTASQISRGACRNTRALGKYHDPLCPRINPGHVGLTDLLSAPA